jgi:hypothetical protein
MMAISPKQKKAGIMIAVAVSAYLIYRWYMNKKAAAANNTNGLGTNLGTAGASVLSSLSAGPSTELNYYGASGTQQTATPVSTSQSSSTSVTGSGNGSGVSSGQTSGPAVGNPITGWGNVLAAAGNNYSGSSPSDFLAAFQATGQNAGQIVPGGTGVPTPLPPGKSYTS